MSQLDSFRRVAEDARFLEWVAKERETALAYLLGATDSVVIYRAQGQVQMLDKITEHANKAKMLR